MAFDSRYRLYTVIRNKVTSVCKEGTFEMAVQLFSWDVMWMDGHDAVFQGVLVFLLIALRKFHLVDASDNWSARHDTR